jgi:predicted nucleic acid-binding protein
VFVLVDSSAWVAFFRDQPPDPRHPILQLGEEKRLATNWCIRVEVLTGARAETELAQLDRRLQALHHLTLSDEVWAQTARLRWGLRRRGLTLPTIDVAIACCAMAYDCELLHADRHFDLIARHTPLRIYKAARTTTRL